MRHFPDSAGRQWAVSLTIDSVKRVKSLLQVDLIDLSAGDPPLLTRLSLDVILLCDVLYAICKPQADAMQPAVSDEQFGQSMGGDALMYGQKALMEELTDFFQKLGRREMSRMIETQAKLIAAAVTHADQKLEGIDVETVVENLMNQSTAGNSSTSGPALSVLTQDHTAFASSTG